MTEPIANDVAVRHPRRADEEAFARLAAAATARGLTLLSTEWQGVRGLYVFICSNGHRFSRDGATALRGAVICLACAQDDVRAKFLDTLRRQGFTCEENAYLGHTVRQHFVCSAGHAWQTLAGKILAGSGCPGCLPRRAAKRSAFADGLARLHAAAAAHGGRCVAHTYLGMNAKYWWECAQGHRWRGNGYSVVKGNWCRLCFARRNGDARLHPDGLARLKAVAASRGGVCLDEVYVGGTAKYQFRCAKGHAWRAHGHLVLAGTWCGRCANLKRMRTIGQMREVAQERGGRCMSDEYLGNGGKLVWECGLGHVWESTPNTVINHGAWCPTCARRRVTNKPKLR